MSIAETVKRLASDPRTPGRLFGLISVIGGVLLLYMHRDIGYWGDDWNFILDRDGWGVDQLFEDHNGHFVVLPVIVFKIFDSLFGTGVMWPYHVLSVALQVSIAWLVFIWVRQRTDAWLALMVGTVVLLLGNGWENIFWNFQIGFLMSMAAGLGALLVFESADSTRNRVWCAVLLGVSVASAGLGVLFLIGIGVRVLWRREWRRALAVVAVSGALFVVWYLMFGHDYDSGSRLNAAPAFARELAINAFAGTFGLDGAWGPVIAGFAVFGLFKLIVRENGMRPELLTVLALPVAFWTLTSIQRAGMSEAYPSRYAYVGVLFLFLIGGVALRGQTFNRGAYIALAGLFAISLVGNLNSLREGSNTLRASTALTTADLTAVSLALPVIPPGAVFEPHDPSLAPQHVPALIELVRDNPDRFTLAEDEVVTGDAGQQGRVDEVFLTLSPPSVVPAQRPEEDALVAPELLDGTASGTVKGACVEVPGDGDGAISVVVPAAGLFVESEGETRVFLRRFAGAFPEDPQATLAPGGNTLTVAGGASEKPWIAGIDAVADATVCGLR